MKEEEEEEGVRSSLVQTRFQHAVHPRSFISDETGIEYLKKCYNIIKGTINLFSTFYIIIRVIF